MMRGMHIAAMLNHTLLYCSHAADLSGFEVVVHVKELCTAVLARWRDVAHVHDHVDNFDRAPVELRAGLVGEIFNTEAHMREVCGRPVCAVIPHPFNLPCAVRGEQRRLEDGGLRVGLVGCGVPPGLVEAVRNMSSVRHVHLERCMVLETTARMCTRFYDKLDVAIAWLNTDAVSNSTKHARVRRFKPAERYQNPVALGIPTIGHTAYESMREIGPDSLLCDSLACVNRTLLALHEHLRAPEHDSRHANAAGASPVVRAVRQAVRLQRVAVQRIIDTLPRMYADLFARVVHAHRVRQQQRKFSARIRRHTDAAARRRQHA